METSQAPERRDVVVVGSGFGGAVSAYRLAQAGLDVCLLERGKSYAPGTFARSPSAMQDNFWDPSEGRHGLFDIWSFRGIDGVISSGLGGGSLIYANVLLRKDEAWFTEQDRSGPDGGCWSWPVNREQLDPHYDAVESMMGATPYPFETDPQYLDTPKTAAMRDAADRLRLDWQLPPLAISFGTKDNGLTIGSPISTPEYGNLHDRPRTTCRLCGECDIGCNYGAKNTLDHNYLSAAAHHGAEIRTLAEVREIAPLPEGGWRVGYVAHAADSDRRPKSTRDRPLVEIHCRRLILSAGTFGTSFLLLSNRSRLPGISSMLGERFSGNGDLLGFMKGARGARGRARRLDGAHGPVITTAIRLPDAADRGERSAGSIGGRGAYIEEAGYPEFANWVLETTRLPGKIRRLVAFVIKRLRAQFRPAMDTNWSAELSDLFGAMGSSASSLPLLGMGRDTADGVMSLHSGRLEVDWSVDTSQEFFDRVSTTMESIAAALNADFEPNPLSYLDRSVTVHPLGGVPMGWSIDDGVVDDRGRVFGLPGLYVLDGSVMPGPVGPNPALTIAAFADRACDHLIEEVGAE